MYDEIGAAAAGTSGPGPGAAPGRVGTAGRVWAGLAIPLLLALGATGVLIALVSGSPGDGIENMSGFWTATEYCAVKTSHVVLPLLGVPYLLIVVAALALAGRIAFTGAAAKAEWIGVLTGGTVVFLVVWVALAQTADQSCS